MNVAYVEPLVAAWERMKRILFRPFDLGKWFIIGFAAWLAGLGGEGGSHWSYSERGDLDLVGDQLRDLLHSPGLIFLFVLAIMLALAIFVALIWLSSRAKLVFLENVVHNRPAIVEPWKRLKVLGDSLFLWRLGFVLAVLVLLVLVAVLLIGPIVVLERGHGAISGLSIAALIFGLLAVLLVGISAAFISLILNSFIVPIMYKFRLSAMDAWRYFIPWMTSNATVFILYALFALALLVGAGVTILLAGVLTLCCGLVLVALPYIGTVVLLPLHVTFRLFSLEFLAQLDPELDVLDGLDPFDNGASGLQAPSGGDPVAT